MIEQIIHWTAPLWMSPAAWVVVAGLICVWGKHMCEKHLWFVLTLLVLIVVCISYGMGLAFLVSMELFGW